MSLHDNSIAPRRNGIAHGKNAKHPARKRSNGDLHERQLQAVLAVLQAAKSGDFTARVAISGADGTINEIANEVNEVVNQLQTVGSEIIRVAREVGTEGKLG